MTRRELLAAVIGLVGSSYSQQTINTLAYQSETERVTRLIETLIAETRVEHVRYVNRPPIGDTVGSESQLRIRDNMQRFLERTQRRG